MTGGVFIRSRRLGTWRLSVAARLSIWLLPVVAEVLVFPALLLPEAAEGLEDS